MKKRAANRRDASVEAAKEEAAPSAKKQRRNTNNSSIDDATSGDQSGTGLRRILHGNIFQLKLLMLFLIRATDLDYKFKLSTEMPGQGGKFDDLIFNYQVDPQGESRFIFLQAKHKQSVDKKITATDLRNETDGDFSLKKYFRSYRKEIANRGMNVQDCIICTNIGFDKNFFVSEDFKLTKINSDDTIFAIEPDSNSKVPARYKLKKTEVLEDLLKRSSDIHYLAEKILECVKNKMKLTLNVDIFKIYHVALVKEKVIENEKKQTFHKDFIANTNSKFYQAFFELWSKEYKISNPLEFEDFLKSSTFTCSDKFGQETSSDKKLDDIVTVGEIEEFLEKLVFVVDMPDEVQLGKIINKEVGRILKCGTCDFQSSFIFEKMLDWFKEKGSTELTEGNNLFEQTRQKMMAFQATASSIDFHAEYLPQFFRKSFQFQEKTISEKANQLEEFLNPTNVKKMLGIITRSCRCTAVKILSALETLPRFKDSVDGYLLIKSEDLELKRHTKEWVKAAMKEENSHEVLVVIGETPVQISVYINELMSNKQRQKKMIYICSGDLDEAKNFKRDEFDSKLLSEKTINKILSTKVTFQGNDVTIKNLVMEKNRLKEILDSSLIEDIFFHQRKVTIPLFEVNPFEKSLWVDRFLLPAIEVAFDEDFFNQLTKKLSYTKDKLDKMCRFIAETNNIEWLIEDDEEKLKIWKEAKSLLLKKNKTPTPIPENDLVADSKRKDQSIFIITGVAGSGKSTFLSRHYDHVKNDESNVKRVWVIRINLVNHANHLSQLKINNNYIDCLVNFPGVCGCTFARSLLRNRLNTSGGVVLLLDGFDEINSECQKNVIDLIKAISNGKTKLDRLIITTRPHLAETLQDELFQFAFSLKNLGKKDQVKYLTQYWRKKSNFKNERLIKKFANSLVDRVTKALKDKERTFIGIPLQCRILAECFQSQLEMSTKKGSPTDLAEIGPNFNIAQLYRMLFKKKSDIFRQEKATGSTDSDLIVKWALEEFLQTLDSFHLKLAIDTIIDEKTVNMLWPPQQPSDFQNDEDNKEEKMKRYALQFGLTSSDTQQSQKLEFLHRTFAEYLVAEFFYKRFFSEKNKDKDQIRDSDERLRDFMIRHILVKNAYEGVRVFLDSMLNDMVTTDKTWRDDTISTSLNESRPNQLQRFALHFSLSMSDYLSSGKGAEALFTSISEGNVGIFDLMLDCLGAIYDRNSGQEIVNKVATEDRVSFFSRSVEIQQRIVIFLRDANDNVVKKLLELMIEEFPFAETKFPDFGREARKAHLILILDFMEKDAKNVQELFNKVEIHPFYCLFDWDGFINDEYYDNELQRFIKLIINNKNFVENFKEYIEEEKEEWNITGKQWMAIEKFLMILKNLQQEDILEELSETMLANPNLYEQVYGHAYLFDNEMISDLCKRVLEGDRNAVSKLKKQFHMADIVRKEDVCENILHILLTEIQENEEGDETKEDDEEDEGDVEDEGDEEDDEEVEEDESDEEDENLKKKNLLDEDGFIGIVWDYAIRQCRTDMLILIMRFVRRHFDKQNRNEGIKALRHLLMRVSDSGCLLLELLEEEALKEIVKRKITEEEDGSDFFSKVFLFIDSSTTKKDFKNGFTLLLDAVLIHFSDTQLSKFIQLIKSKYHKIEFRGIQHSIWALTIARAKSGFDWQCGCCDSDCSKCLATDCDTFLKIVASRLNKKHVKNLLLHKEDNVVVLYRTALMRSNTNLVNKMCHLLPKETRDDVSKDFNEKAPNMILDMFTQYSKEMLPYKVHITNLIHFFVKHANDEQMLLLVDIVTSLIGGRTYWEHLFDHLSNETILKILTRISELKGVGNENKRDEKLLTINGIQGHHAIVIRAAQQRGEEFIQEMLDFLSKNFGIREEFKKFLEMYAPQRIEELFFSEEPEFWKCKSEIRWNSLNFFLNHCNESQLSELVNVITTFDKRNNCSIWGNCIEEIIKFREERLLKSEKNRLRNEACRQLEMFLENVIKRKLGGDSVIELLLHNDGQQQGKKIIFIRIVFLLTYYNILYTESSEDTRSFTINEDVLNEEKQNRFRQKLTPFINQFIKDKTNKKNSQDEWIRLMHFYLDYSNNDSNLSANFLDVITQKDCTDREESIWEYIFMDSGAVKQLSDLLRHVKEKLKGEDVLKMLALKKNGKGRFILGEALTRGDENKVKNMYAYLSTENRNEIFATLFSDPYIIRQLDVKIGSLAFSDNTNGELLMYFELVKTTRQINGRKFNMWTNYVVEAGVKWYLQTFQGFMKLITDKLGEEYFKRLVDLLHVDPDGQSIFATLITKGEYTTVDEMFSLLSPSSQVKVRDIAYTTPGLIKKMLSRKGSDYWCRHYLKINSADGTASNLPDGFDILASYFLDKFNLEQLKQFITFITSLNKVKGKTRSIWGDYIEKACSINAMEEERKRFSVRSIDRLLNVVSSSELGATAVVQLLYHYDGNHAINNYLTLPENQEIAEFAFHYLEPNETKNHIEFLPIDGRR